jgi:Ser/Thr protein kinase RdoA (MazF antagonist)
MDPSTSQENSSFFSLTPDRILNVIEEKTGLRCSGRCLALNSLENRVFEIEIMLTREQEKNLVSPYERFVVAKFYRPGRWTEIQLLEEHKFSQQIFDAEIPVVTPLSYEGATLHKMDEEEIWFTIFPKVGGRIILDPNDEQLERLGRLLARLHNIGKSEKAKNRLNLTPQTYGEMNIENLLKENWIPIDLESRYKKITSDLMKIMEPMFKNLNVQRIHGDCHLGNVLWRDEGPILVDFDDMVTGPTIQDVWLLTPNRDDEGLRQRALFLEAYDTFVPFNRKDVSLIEPLRTLRYIHYSAWIARRWKDPAFQRAFPDFTSWGYWSTHINDLELQFKLIVNQ